VTLFFSLALLVASFLRLGVNEYPEISSPFPALTVLPGLVLASFGNIFFLRMESGLIPRRKQDSQEVVCVASGLGDPQRRLVRSGLALRGGISRDSLRSYFMHLERGVSRSPCIAIQLHME
jgi:hypothetical protein